MKRSVLFGVSVVLLAGATLGSAFAQVADTAAPPANAPTTNNLPPAVSSRLGGAQIKPNPQAKPVEGLVIPPMFPPAAPGSRKSDK